MSKLSKPRPWLAITLGLAISFSQGALSQEGEQVEESEARDLSKVVILNENGRVSISYDAPNWYEVGDYAFSLGTTMIQDLSVGRAECQQLMTQLEEDSLQILGARTERIIASIFSEETFDYGTIISSMLSQYANQNNLDIETADSPGSYHPISSPYCTNRDISNFGIMEHIFLPPTNPRLVGGNVWNVKTCEKVDEILACFFNTARKHMGNKAASGDKAVATVELPVNTTFSFVGAQSAAKK